MLETLAPFIDRVLNDLESARLDVSCLLLDHACYRVATPEEYVTHKRLLVGHGRLLIEAEVNGRPIATYLLHEPIVHAASGRRVRVIELPAPKAGSPYPTGFEHLEFVSDRDLGQLHKNISALGLRSKVPARLYGLNPELSVTLASTTVKFHPLPLEAVIILEKDMGPRTLALLETLAPFEVAISGSIPIGVAGPGSDLDLLCRSDDFGALEAALRDFEPSFETRIMPLGGVHSLVARGRIEGQRVEIVAQTISPFEQRAQRHLRIESRLINAIGPRLADAVRIAKSTGLNTEAAFAKTLGLEGDAYAALEALETITETELARRFAPIT